MIHGNDYQPWSWYTDSLKSLPQICNSLAGKHFYISCFFQEFSKQVEEHKDHLENNGEEWLQVVSEIRSFMMVVI